MDKCDDCGEVSDGYCYCRLDHALDREARHDAREAARDMAREEMIAETFPKIRKMRKISAKIILMARPGLDLIITRESNSNLISLDWQPHAPMPI